MLTLKFNRFGFCLRFFYLYLLFGFLKVESESVEGHITIPTLNTYLTYLSSKKSIKEFSLGHAHTLILREDGKVYSWGWNERGQLGLGDKDNRYAPAQIPYSKSNGILISKIALGYLHNLTLDSKGKVYSWGDNNGQLGLEDNENRVILLPQS